MCKAHTELIAPAANRLVADNHAAFEQRLLHITQTKLKPEVPPNCVADDRCRDPMTVVKRFCFLHGAILCDSLVSVTEPRQALDA
jgi:hypothetical protein